VCLLGREVGQGVRSSSIALALARHFPCRRHRRVHRRGSRWAVGTTLLDYGVVKGVWLWDVERRSWSAAASQMSCLWPVNWRNSLSKACSESATAAAFGMLCYFLCVMKQAQTCAPPVFRVAAAMTDEQFAFVVCIQNTSQDTLR
jgi:hypothetical protein